MHCGQLISRFCVRSLPSLPKHTNRKAVQCGSRNLARFSVRAGRQLVATHASSCAQEIRSPAVAVLMDTTAVYRLGVFEGSSRSSSTKRHLGLASSLNKWLPLAILS